MRSTRPWIGLGALGAILALAGSGARSGWAGPDAPPVPTTWRVEAQVVRLDVPPETAEQAPAWPGAEGEAGAVLIGAPWAEVLTRLKGRGTSLLMMDRTGTALAGTECAFEQQRRSQGLVVASSGPGGTEQRATPFQHGARVKLSVADAAPGNGVLLRYGLVVTWVEAPTASSASPRELACTWEGSAHLASGQTLVLRQAHQDTGREGQRQATEVYALLTVRR